MVGRLGESLAGRPPLPLRAVLPLWDQLIQRLEVFHTHTHRRHGSVKPANLVMGTGDTCGVACTCMAYSDAQGADAARLVKCERSEVRRRGGHFRRPGPRKNQ